MLLFTGSLPLLVSSNMLCIMQYIYMPFQRTPIYTVNYEILLLSNVEKDLFEGDIRNNVRRTICLVSVLKNSHVITDQNAAHKPFHHLTVVTVVEHQWSTEPLTSCLIKETRCH